MRVDLIFALNQVPYAAILGSASASDIALVCMSLPQLLNSTQDDEAVTSPRNHPVMEVDASAPLSSERVAIEHQDSAAPVLLRDPSLLQPISMLASAASSSFAAMPPHLLHGTACALAKIGYPASTAWLDAHARVMAETDATIMAALGIDALDRAYAVMRKCRRQSSLEAKPS